MLIKRERIYQLGQRKKRFRHKKKGQEELGCRNGAPGRGAD